MSLRAPQHALALVLATLLAVACGGGGDLGSGGTGSTPGTSAGTVTGFGSVFVDGVRFDDFEAPVEQDAGNGQAVATTLKLGHQVALEFKGEAENTGIASRVRVEPTVVGRVAVASAGGLELLGQTVRYNTDPAAGPVTVFEPADAASRLVVGSPVEVHGVRRTDAQGQEIIQATRVEMRLLIAAVRVAGTVTGLTDAGGGTQRFRIAGLTVERDGGTLVLPRSAALTEGAPVAVFASAATAPGATRLVAQRIVVRERRTTAEPQDYLGGLVSALGADRFMVGGLVVRYGSATAIEGGALADGAYVRVRGRYAADGSLVATRIKRRDASDEKEAELRGTVSGLSGSRFHLRDTLVDAAGARFDWSKCPGTTALADGLFVKVEGRATAAGVVATEVECESEGSDPTAIISREGTLQGTPDAAARRFVIATERGDVAVRWTTLTYFDPAIPGGGAGLATGMRLDVDGRVIDGVLVATRIRLD
jgi:hypothetical protein